MSNRPLLSLVALALVCTGCATSRPSVSAPSAVTPPPADGRQPFDPDAVHNQSGRRTMDRVSRDAVAPRPGGRGLSSGRRRERHVRLFSLEVHERVTARQRRHDLPPEASTLTREVPAG